MAIRIQIIFLPYLLGLIWHDQSVLSIIWSLASSIFIAITAQTKWFRQPSENIPVTHRLLRPAFMHHFIFVIYHVLGGGAYALNAAGYAIGSTNARGDDLFLISECQQLMLLGHASITAGMKLAGLRYSNPKYLIPPIPSSSLIIVSFITFGIGTLISTTPPLIELSQKLFSMSVAAISVDIVLCIQKRRFNNLMFALALLGLNLISQAVSGWKGAILWTMITSSSLLYPLMPRRVIVIGITFVLFWALYFYPFGLALRPLLWNEGVEQSRAIEISLNETLHMSLMQRLDNVWVILAGRANDLYQFGKYVEYVPARHPYYKFEVVNDAMIALVPRIIWADKPDLEKMSMRRVYDAGVTSEQSIVSAKSNLYQDAYLSGGEGAIILAGLLFGILSILISRICERLFGGYNIGTCLIYTSLYGSIISQPPNFEFFVGGAQVTSIMILALFTLGRVTGLIIPANKSSNLPESQAHILVGQKKAFPSLSRAGVVSTQHFRNRR